MKDLIISILSRAIERARAAGQLATAPPAAASVEAPKDPAHGDAASNVALVMARGEKNSAIPRFASGLSAWWSPPNT